MGFDGNNKGESMRMIYYSKDNFGNLFITKKDIQKLQTHLKVMKRTTELIVPLFDIKVNNDLGTTKVML